MKNFSNKDLSILKKSIDHELKSRYKLINIAQKDDKLILESFYVDANDKNLINDITGEFERYGPVTSNVIINNQSVITYEDKRDAEDAYRYRKKILDKIKKL